MFNHGRLLCNLLYAVPSLYQCWSSILGRSSLLSDFLFSRHVYPTWASAHPFIIVCGTLPFQRLLFPSCKSARLALLMFAPLSDFRGYDFGQPSWEIDLSVGPTECFHVGNLVHVWKAGVFAGSVRHTIGKAQFQTDQ
jgi:hypothetical protein